MHVQPLGNSAHTTRTIPTLHASALTWSFSSLTLPNTPIPRTHPNPPGHRQLGRYAADDIVALVEAAILANNRAGATPFAIASFSHVASVPGIILPVDRLAALCHRHGILVLVDGAHAPGQIPLDIGQLGVDVYVGNGHKWMFTARGCAFVWVSPKVQPLIYPTVIEAFPGYSASSGSHGINGDASAAQAADLPYPGAMHSMFDWQGTKDYSAYLSITPALAFRRSLGGEAAIAAYTHGLAVEGGVMLAKAWGTQTMPAAVTGAMANVELPCRTHCPPDLALQLYRRHKFYVPVVALPAGAATPSYWMRISVGVYTAMADFELVRDAVTKMLGAAAAAEFPDAAVAATA